MIHITLACASGMSTSLLVSKMKKAAKEKGVEAKIIAVSEKKFDEYFEETDVLLLGPQVSFLESKYTSLEKDLKLKVASIPILEYGRMDGEKVLMRALALLEQKEEKNG